MTRSTHPDLQQEAQEAAQEVASTKAAYEAALQDRLAVVARLRRAGYGTLRIGKLVGLHRSRVQVLLDDATKEDL